MCLFVKFIHETHATTSYFTLSIKFKNPYEQTNEPHKLSNEIDEFSEGESGYCFDSIAKLSIKMFRYRDMRASSYCKLPIPFCTSKSILNMQNDDNYCFLWCILAQLHEVDIHREWISHYEKQFHELNHGDIQIPMKIKHPSTFEELNN